eukprot:1702861-Prymnesium_polylepis.1
MPLVGAPRALVHAAASVGVLAHAVTLVGAPRALVHAAAGVGVLAHAVPLVVDQLALVRVAVGVLLALHASTPLDCAGGAERAWSQDITSTLQPSEPP